MIEDQQLAELVVMMGLISEVHLTDPQSLQARHGGSLYNTLIENGFVDEEQTIQLVGQMLHIPSVSLKEFRADPNIIELVTADQAARFRAIPLGLAENGRRLILAMADPTDVMAMEEISQHTGREIMAFLGGPLDIDQTLEQIYGHAIYENRGSLESLFDAAGVMPMPESVDDGPMGPSVSQLLALPMIDDNLRPADPAMTSLPMTGLQAPSSQDLAEDPLFRLHNTDDAPVIEISDLDQLFQVEDNVLEGIEEDQGPELFEFSGSKIFMLPEAMNDAGRKRMQEVQRLQDEFVPPPEIGHTMVGGFHAFEELEGSSVVEPSIDDSIPVPPEFITGDESIMPGVDAGAFISMMQRGSQPKPEWNAPRPDRPRAFAAPNAIALEEALMSASSEDLVSALVELLIERQVIPQDEFLRVLRERQGE